MVCIRLRDHKHVLQHVFVWDKWHITTEQNNSQGIMYMSSEIVYSSKTNGTYQQEWFVQEEWLRNGEHVLLHNLFIWDKQLRDCEHVLWHSAFVWDEWMAHNNKNDSSVTKSWGIVNVSPDIIYSSETNGTQYQEWFVQDERLRNGECVLSHNLFIWDGWHITRNIHPRRTAEESWTYSLKQCIRLRQMAHNNKTKSWGIMNVSSDTRRTAKRWWMCPLKQSVGLRRTVEKSPNLSSVRLLYLPLLNCTGLTQICSAHLCKCSCALCCTGKFSLIFI